MQSALKKVKGLGASGNGTSHWWHQRVTAIALIPLYLWFTTRLICTVHGFHSLSDIFASAFSVILFTILLITSLYHGALGVKVIIEDYVHCEKAKLALTIFTNFLVIFTAVSLIFAIFSQYFTTLIK